MYQSLTDNKTEENILTFYTSIKQNNYDIREIQGEKLILDIVGSDQNITARFTLKMGCKRGMIIDAIHNFRKAGTYCPGKTYIYDSFAMPNNTCIHHI
jgi:hypothetical protein